LATVEVGIVFIESTIKTGCSATLCLHDH
jgi:hypothetical protein